MKHFRIILCLTLLAATGFQAWMAVRYRQLADGLKAQAMALKERTTTLTSQSEKLNQLTHKQQRLNQLPLPWAETLRTALQEDGYTNLNCLVWGEKGGKQLGFMVDSNEVTVMPGMEVRMKHVEADAPVSRKRL